jgi:hypothetical protein
VRSEPVQQREQRALLAGPPGAADQAVGEGGGGQHHDVARPRIEVGGEHGERGLGVAGHEMGKIGDVAGFACRQSGGAARRRHLLARRHGIAAFQQDVRSGRMGEREAGIGFDGAIEGFDCAGVHGELGLTASDVGIACSR